MLFLKKLNLSRKTLERMHLNLLEMFLQLWLNYSILSISNKKRGDTKQMKRIKCELENMKGKHVNIYTRHYLFDSQNLEAEAFIPITDIGIGFQYGNQNIYIKENEVESYDIKEDRIIINGKEMVMMFIKTS